MKPTCVDREKLRDAMRQMRRGYLLKVAERAIDLVSSETLEALVGDFMQVPRLAEGQPGEASLPMRRISFLRKACAVRRTIGCPHCADAPGNRTVSPKPTLQRTTQTATFCYFWESPRQSDATTISTKARSSGLENVARLCTVCCCHPKHVQ
jgi:hypothetical protein